RSHHSDAASSICGSSGDGSDHWRSRRSCDPEIVVAPENEICPLCRSLRLDVPILSFHPLLPETLPVAAVAIETSLQPHLARRLGARAIERGCSCPRHLGRQQRRWESSHPPEAAQRGPPRSAHSAGVRTAGEHLRSPLEYPFSRTALVLDSLPQRRAAPHAS